MELDRSIKNLSLGKDLSTAGVKKSAGSKKPKKKATKTGRRFAELEHTVQHLTALLWGANDEIATLQAKNDDLEMQLRDTTREVDAFKQQIKSARTVLASTQALVSPRSFMHSPRCPTLSLNGNVLVRALPKRE